MVKKFEKMANMDKDLKEVKQNTRALQNFNDKIVKAIKGEVTKQLEFLPKANLNQMSGLDRNQSAQELG